MQTSVAAIAINRREQTRGGGGRDPHRSPVSTDQRSSVLRESVCIRASISPPIRCRRTNCAIILDSPIRVIEYNCYSGNYSSSAGIAISARVPRKKGATGTTDDRLRMYLHWMYKK